MTQDSPTDLPVSPHKQAGTRNYVHAGHWHAGHCLTFNTIILFLSLITINAKPYP